MRVIRTIVALALGVLVIFGLLAMIGVLAGLFFNIDTAIIGTIGEIASVFEESNSAPMVKDAALFILVGVGACLNSIWAALLFVATSISAITLIHKWIRPF